mmetsp:Transcript_18727/g.42588  ORF Transcript_18727/g.42588 Transcript_18727/m.42588 type:complete len:312 (-) Transcript_18727:632-1567(-)
MGRHVLGPHVLVEFVHLFAERPLARSQFLNNAHHVRHAVTEEQSANDHGKHPKESLRGPFRGNIAVADGRRRHDSPVEPRYIPLEVGVFVFPYSVGPFVGPVGRSADGIESAREEVARDEHHCEELPERPHRLLRRHGVLESRDYAQNAGQAKKANQLEHAHNAAHFRQLCQLSRPSSFVILFFGITGDEFALQDQLQWESRHHIDPKPRFEIILCDFPSIENDVAFNFNPGVEVEEDIRDEENVNCVCEYPMPAPCCLINVDVESVHEGHFDHDPHHETQSHHVPVIPHLGVRVKDVPAWTVVSSETDGA